MKVRKIQERGLSKVTSAMLLVFALSVSITGCSNESSYQTEVQPQQYSMSTPETPKPKELDEIKLTCNSDAKASTDSKCDWRWVAGSLVASVNPLSLDDSSGQTRGIGFNVWKPGMDKSTSCALQLAKEDETAVSIGEKSSGEYSAFPSFVSNNSGSELGIAYYALTKSSGLTPPKVHLYLQSISNFDKMSSSSETCSLSSRLDLGTSEVQSEYYDNSMWGAYDDSNVGARTIRFLGSTDKDEVVLFERGEKCNNTTDCTYMNKFIVISKELNSIVNSREIQGDLLDYNASVNTKYSAVYGGIVADNMIFVNVGKRTLILDSHTLGDIGEISPIDSRVTDNSKFRRVSDVYKADNDTYFLVSNGDSQLELSIYVFIKSQKTILREVALCNVKSYDKEHCDSRDSYSVEGTSSDGNLVLSTSTQGNSNPLVFISKDGSVGDILSSEQWDSLKASFWGMTKQNVFIKTADENIIIDFTGKESGRWGKWNPVRPSVINSNSVEYKADSWVLWGDHTKGYVDSSTYPAWVVTKNGKYPE
ncbi:hypothetical protein FACS1894125_5790 [Actinomycetota bacterium]|nr:hypothetical protein FACS1894125_5790 [Actinomycetota bacterium]